MSKYILIEVIDREIHTKQFDNLDEAWVTVVNEFNEFVKDNGIDQGYDCEINENWLSAWANGSFCCVDWQIEKID